MTQGEELMLVLLKCTQSCGGEEFLRCGAGNGWEMEPFQSLRHTFPRCQIPKSNIPHSLNSEFLCSPN